MRRIILSSGTRHYFATDSNKASPPPIVMDILKRIKADLKEADVNHDGRIDFEELKFILKKIPSSLYKR